jgi:regulator of RNase E activity RraB
LKKTDQRKSKKPEPITITSMGLFNVLKKNNTGQFLTERKFQDNSDRQVEMTPQTLKQLRKYGVTADDELRLEFFFYSNTLWKVEKLSDELKRLNYEVQFSRSQGNKELFISTGWTSKMKMDNGTVTFWTKEMCKLGYKFDCDFDGWGTTPNQE